MILSIRPINFLKNLHFACLLVQWLKCLFCNFYFWQFQIFTMNQIKTYLFIQRVFRIIINTDNEVDPLQFYIFYKLYLKLINYSTSEIICFDQPTHLLKGSIICQFKSTLHVKFSAVQIEYSPNSIVFIQPK